MSKRGCYIMGFLYGMVTTAGIMIFLEIVK